MIMIAVTTFLAFLIFFDIDRNNIHDERIYYEEAI